MEIKFKVAMDNEQKKLGNVEEITLDVDFEGVPDAIVRKAALAHAVVSWQSQIRSHWTDFKEGKLPTSVTFGNPLFTSTRRVAIAPITQETALAFIQSLTPEARADMVQKMQG